MLPVAPPPGAFRPSARCLNAPYDIAPVSTWRCTHRGDRHEKAMARCLPGVLNYCCGDERACWASASVTINGRTVSQTDSGSNLFPLRLAESFFFMASNSESGRAPISRSTTWRTCATTAARRDAAGRPCLPPYTGFEVAKLDFDVAYRDGRALNRYIEASTDVPSHLTRQTGGDSFADMLTESGTIHVHVTNASFLPESDSFLVYGAVWCLPYPSRRRGP